MDSRVLQELKQDFHKLARDPEIIAILAFGSHVSGDNTLRSDVDVCIVAPESKDKVETLRQVWREIGGKYDSWLFEELPLYIQAEVINNHEIVYCDDSLSLFEYFYKFRKSVTEYYHRQQVAIREAK